MENKQFLSEEAKKRIAELQIEIKRAKNKIKKALNNDLGISYIVWEDGNIYERMDFTSSINSIYPYLEVIKSRYATMDEVIKKSITNQQ
ncbi:MAG TPA: hypothetical protein PLP39_09535 [Flavobacterium lutivivi]|nr:hypothetical protein [Flavobacterium lutivivi]